MMSFTLRCDGAGCKAAVAVKMDTRLPGWHAHWAIARVHITGRLYVEMSMVTPLGWQLLADRQILCPTCRLARIVTRPMLEEPADV